MTDAPASPPPGSTLQDAADGRSGERGSLRDPRVWRELLSAHARPGLLMAGVLVAAYVWQLTRPAPLAWGLSAQALAEGRWPTLFTHMFAHGGHWHLFMNVSALIGLSAVVMARFGSRLDAWLRLAVLYFGAGLAGAALFLLINPTGSTPMVGASGAIFGLLGAAARIGRDGTILPIRSTQVWRVSREAFIANLILFGALFLLVRAAGGTGGLAWEAHLGGFLVGLFAVAWLAPGRGAAGAA